MARLIVVGAGAMGLAAAYHACKAGHEVTVVEAGPEAGGMAAHFDFDGLSIERFYHFICKNDFPHFELLEELGIADKLKWRSTKMGYYMDGRLQDWGDPISLLKFKGVSLAAKIRYGLLAFVSTKRDSWDAIEGETAKSWITRWVGQEAWKKFWEPLLTLKFYEYADKVSASWIWTRVKRTGRSRKSLFEEQLGYLEGGSQTMVDTLVEKIEGMGGTILIAEPATKVETVDGKVTGVTTTKGFHPADAVIMTIPTPYVSQTVPDLPADWKAKYDAIPNIGVVCLLFKLKKSVVPYFWLNVSDESMGIPGIIEFSNLRPIDDTVVFVPYYMPTTHEKWDWSDDAILDEAWSYLKKINPKITEADLIARYAARLRYAQPVCMPNFLDTLPPVVTPIEGLQIADTSYYYPEDRGISEGVRFAKDMAARV